MGIASLRPVACIIIAGPGSYRRGCYFPASLNIKNMAVMWTYYGNFPCRA